MPENRIDPISFPIPPDILLGNGTMLVHLPTLDSLETFWRENTHRFSYAVQGLEWGHEPSFLNAYEWVFGPTKAAVISTVCRWDQVGIEYEWYDWATEEPEHHALWFQCRAERRLTRIAAGSWTEKDEAEHQQDLIARTPETYRGFWELTNLPCGFADYEWFGPHCKTGPQDRNWPEETIARVMQEKTFNAWSAMDADEVECLTADEVDSVIAYWKHERAIGADSYGVEDEV